MVWLVLFFACALFNWLSTDRRWRWGELISKPLALVLLIVFFWQTLGWQGGRLWFGVGLVFSLAGDIFLMWMKRFFVPGLASFLLAHVCYIIALNQDAIQFQAWVLVLAAMVTGVGFTCYRIIRRGMVKNPESARLRLPVLAYCLMISLMLLSAWVCLFREGWSTPAGWMAAAGASLFILSDFMLAYGLFVKPIQRGDLLVMVTYHLGQAAIILGAVLRFMGN